MGKIYAGTSGWAYSTWKPGFYPAKLGAAKFLEYYSSRLNSVEVNYTFRAFPSKKLLQGWIDKTPADFKFAIKAHQLITHLKRLHDPASSTPRFVDSLQPLLEANKLGPVLFQLPPNLKCDVPLLTDFLAGLPRSLRSAFEFRHASWFSDEVFAVLRKANVALCWAESEELKTPNVETADYFYLRLRKEAYSSRAVKEVQQNVRTLASKGDVFVYFKHEDTPDGAFCAEKMLGDDTQK
jgi:uncharacterized protein YecE (DUF72 family)